jgi:hypothetical protein
MFDTNGDDVLVLIYYYRCVYTFWFLFLFTEIARILDLDVI